MNAKHLIAAATVALVGASAFAQEGVQWPDASVQVTQKTRAEVQAELAAARAANPLFSQSEQRWLPDTTFVSTRSRDEVRAEAVQATKQRFNKVDRDYIGG